MRFSISAFFLIASFLPPEPAHAGSESVYMDLRKDCKVLEKSEEGAYSLSECRPLGGHRFVVDDSDGKVRVLIRSGGKESAISSGITFSELGDKIEWRVKAGGKSKEPHAVIFRLKYWDDAKSRMEKGGTLWVVRVTAKESCVLEQIDANKVKNANEKARQVADDLTKGCSGN